MYINKTLTDKTFLVIGTGTTGLITACSLSFSFPNCKIKIIDKAQPEVIGVGEGTTGIFELTMKGCGFEIPDWFEALDTTWKLGVLYENWRGNNDLIWHPFAFKSEEADLWSGLNLSTESFQEHVFPEWMSYQKNNKTITMNKMQSSYFGWHIDASLLNKFLFTRLSERKNVEFMFDEIAHVNYNNDESILNIACVSGQEHSADLYFDGSGFSGLLSKHKNRVDLIGELFVNAAVVTQIPFSDPSQPIGTIATCCDHGWIWTIPTQSRIGTGLVYNKSCTSLEEAKASLIKHWQQKGVTIDNNSIKVLAWDPFYLTNPWHENSISCGLAGSFVEPLEATTLQHLGILTHDIIASIEEYFIGNDKSLVRSQLNNQHVRMLLQAVDFLRVHYESPRTDTLFWQYVKRNYKITKNQRYFESLMQDPKIAMSFTLPAREALFQYWHYAAWWIQYKRVKPVFHSNMAESVMQEKLQALKDKAEQESKETLETLELSDWYNKKFTHKKYK